MTDDTLPPSISDTVEYQVRTMLHGIGLSIDCYQMHLDSGLTVSQARRQVLTTWRRYYATAGRSLDPAVPPPTA